MLIWIKISAITVLPWNIGSSAWLIDWLIDSIQNHSFQYGHCSNMAHYIHRAEPCILIVLDRYTHPSNLRKWKWSMVTHTLNLCSAFNPSKCTHTAVNTHTPWTHTRSSGQPFMLRRPGSSWGFGVLLKGTSVVVLKVERALYIHSHHLQFLPTRDSKSRLWVRLSNH